MKDKREVSESNCTQCKPWDDDGCDFGCPCADCEIGRRYEAFCTSPARDVPSLREAERELKRIRAAVVAEGRRNG